METLLSRLGVRGHSDDNKVLMYGSNMESILKSIHGYSKNVKKVSPSVLNGKFGGTAFLVNFDWYKKNGLNRYQTNIGGTKPLKFEKNSIIYIDYLLEVTDELIQKYKEKYGY